MCRRGNHLLQLSDLLLHQVCVRTRRGVAQATTQVFQRPRVIAFSSKYYCQKLLGVWRFVAGIHGKGGIGALLSHISMPEIEITYSAEVPKLRGPAGVELQSLVGCVGYLLPLLLLSCNCSNMLVWWVELRIRGYRFRISVERFLWFLGLLQLAHFVPCLRKLRICAYSLLQFLLCVIRMIAVCFNASLVIGLKRVFRSRSSCAAHRASWGLFVAGKSDCAKI